jgi:hypothetical protein
MSGHTIRTKSFQNDQVFDWLVLDWSFCRTPLIINSILGGGGGLGWEAGGVTGGRRGDSAAVDGLDRPSPSLVALLTAAPFSLAAAFTVLNAWHSQKTGAPGSCIAGMGTLCMAFK